MSLRKKAKDATKDLLNQERQEQLDYENSIRKFLWKELKADLLPEISKEDFYALPMSFTVPTAMYMHSAYPARCWVSIKFPYTAYYINIKLQINKFLWFYNYHIVEYEVGGTDYNNFLRALNMAYEEL